MVFGLRIGLERLGTKVRFSWDLEREGWAGRVWVSVGKLGTRVCVWVGMLCQNMVQFRTGWQSRREFVSPNSLLKISPTG